MLNLRRVFKNYNETGSFNEQINLRGFIDSSIFQTKTGDVGVIRAHSRLGIRNQHHALQG